MVAKQVLIGHIDHPYFRKSARLVGDIKNEGWVVITDIARTELWRVKGHSQTKDNYIVRTHC